MNEALLYECHNVRIQLEIKLLPSVLMYCPPMETIANAPKSSRNHLESIIGRTGCSSEFVLIRNYGKD